MGDKPDFQPEKNSPEMNSNDCKDVYELKDDVEHLPLTESIYKDAKLVCSGDSQTATRNLVDGGRLPEMSIGEVYEPSNLLLQMDNRNDNVKAGLTNAEKDTLLDLESAIVNCDSATLSAKLKEFEADPKKGEKLMGVLVKDLERAGYQAKWSYTTDETRPGFGQDYQRGPAFGGGYYLTGKEDVGHLTITSDSRHDTYNSVSFSTRGESAAINTPKPSIDGSASSSAPGSLKPDEALKEAAQHAAHTA
jgi:hypothetical protein